MTGRAYALPTKDENLRSLSLRQIRANYDTFLQTVFDNPDKVFVLTPVGAGLAGHSFDDIKEMVMSKCIPANLVLSYSWIER